MGGAGHSEDGIVTQTREAKVIVISLVDHVVGNAAWKDKLLSSASKARIGAGKSFYDLMGMIRPNGFLLKSRTAGRFFTIGECNL
jgi:hypothetical protein